MVPFTLAVKGRWGCPTASTPRGPWGACPASAPLGAAADFAGEMSVDLGQHRRGGTGPLRPSGLERPCYGEDADADHQHGRHTGSGQAAALGTPRAPISRQASAPTTDPMHTTLMSAVINRRASVPVPDVQRRWASRHRPDSGRLARCGPRCAPAARW